MYDFQGGLEEFHSILKEERNVLVHFWENSCDVCEVQNQDLREMDRKFAPRLTVVGVDVDKNPDLREHFEVQETPTLMVFYRGRKILFGFFKRKDRLTSPLGQRELEKLIENILSIHIF